MTLRSRLLLGLLGLVSIGLVVSNLVTYRALRSFLYDRLDTQLADAVDPISFQLTGGRRGGPGGPGGPGRGPGDDVVRADNSIPTGTWAAQIDPGGHISASLCVGCSQAPLEGPRPSFGAKDLDQRDPVTVGGTAGAGRYRLLAVAEPDGDTVVLAMPLREVEQTTGRLVGIEVAATVLVLASVGLTARFLVRRGLRPLEDIGHTAGAIAAGDLSRRVELADDRTEVGQLGLALNAMLGRIEAAFSAQQASENRLRRFIADASHELRTPLTSIRGYAELFRRGAAERPDDLAKAMRRIEQEAERMGVLVDDLLLLARLDQGRPLEREPVDLARVAADAVDDARAVDPGRSITLVSPDTATVHGDDVRLRQVVANLLTNARQHTPPGTSVRVGVRVDGGSAVLEVADDGPGLPPEQAARVFERFYRADESRARAYGGTGLGLAIVAAIVEAHGGSTTVDTEPGRGATFRVVLPLVPAATEPGAPAAPAPISQEAFMRPTGNSQPS